MRYRELGKTGLMASVIGLGTFEIGGSSWWDPVDQKVAIDTIRIAADLGINFIDTAPVYGFGQSEKIVGSAVKGLRHKFILCTKVGEEFNGRNEGRFHYNHDGKSVYTCLTRAAIVRQLEDSLRNLGTDYIDIYMPHFYFDDPSVGRIEDVIDTLKSLIDQGKIRSVGFSNISASHLSQFAELGPSRIACMQLYSNVLDHGLVNPELLALAIAHGISGVGINCLAKGLLAGAIPDDYVVREGSERSESAWFYDGRIAEVNAMLTRWSHLQERHSASAASLSLAWVLAQPGMTHLLTGVTHPDHVRIAAQAADIGLQPEELQLMTSDAVGLRARAIEKDIQAAALQIETLAVSRQPVAVWGAGVTLDYLCRRLPLAACNVVGVYDSNPRLHGEMRLGCPVSELGDGRTVNPSTTLVVAIPRAPTELDAILQNQPMRFLSVIHLGHLKALCK
jgi:methylglyoxal reductase